MNKTIRNVDTQTWRLFKSLAARREVTLAELLSALIIDTEAQVPCIIETRKED